MDVGLALLRRARACGAASLAVVGTRKNAGKSVAIAALVDALARESASYALCSIGRDGEAIDAVDGGDKPRFFLRAGALFATATPLVPRSPAYEIVCVTAERCALGPIAIVRARAPGFVEIAGPPSASALRRVVANLATRASFVAIDGAVDRIAALHGGDDAIVVAVGAAGAASFERAVEDVAALVARLALRPVAPGVACVDIAGALGASAASALVAAGERRPVVVEDATRIAFGGRTYRELAARLDLRCRRPLRPIACTVAPAGRERTFEPFAFARAVARATGLPCYDVYAGTATNDVAS